MGSTAGRLTRNLPIAAGLPLALGALYAYVAYKSNPLVPALIVLILILFVASMYRPVIGVAIAIVLIPLGGLLAGAPPVLDIPPRFAPITWTAIMIPVCLFHRPRNRWRPPPFGLAVGIFALVGVVAVGVGSNLQGTGEVIHAFALGILLFFITTLAVQERSDVLWIIRAVAVAASLFGGLAIYQYLTGSSGVGFFDTSGELVGRAVAGFDQPNQLGGFLLVTIAPMVAGLLLDRRWRWLHAAGIVLALGGIYASFSRGALLGLVVIPLVMLPRRRLVLLIPVAVVGAAIALPLVLERFTTFAADTSTSSRLDIWSTALSIFGQHPITGVGLGGFPDAYAAIRIPGKEFLPDTLFQPPPHAHNLELNLLAEEGLLGFVSFFVVIALALHATVQLRRLPDRWLSTMGNAMLATILAFLIHNLFDVTLITRGGYFWVLLGLLSSLVIIARREAEDGSASWARGP